MANIEHLVVLMMENRSFDHMFGFLKSPTWQIDGLTGNESNADSQGNNFTVTPNARDAGDLTPDPGHDFLSVNEQIFGNSAGTGNGPFMQGFVKAYEGKTKKNARNVMKCFGPGRMPVLSKLAQEYAVCDRWFSSVPGPTLPNRAFAMGATSLGRVDMSPNYLSLRTIFQLLDENGVSSKIYYNDWTLALAVGFIAKRSKKFLHFFDDFAKDCKNNKLPAVSFVEPRFNDLSIQGEFFGAADQHPDHNMRLGERVIHDVYQAVTSNQTVWERTLLVITYDEHGGLYDHVKPPATVNPGDRPEDTTVFDFKRLGVRVPAVLVSPFIRPGTIISKTLDHTSIIATASKLFIPTVPNNFLTERDKKAATFEDCLQLPTPRQGRATFDSATPVPLSASSPMSFNALASKARSDVMAAPTPKKKSKTAPLSDFQQAMIMQAYIADKKSPGRVATKEMRISAISTEQQAAEYLLMINENVAASARKPGKQAKTANVTTNVRKPAKTSKKKAKRARR